MIQDCLKQIQDGRLPDGGFAGTAGDPVFRPDVTAWAVLALVASQAPKEITSPARNRLAQAQLDDGRVPISGENPQAFWPTPLAVLAWTGGSGYQAVRQKAVQFLLRTSGLHWQREADSPFGHDTFIPGWPWTELTHSWVEPTALSVIALKEAGLAAETRVQQAVKLLLDRQLSGGGWNYGNTTVFRQELRPLVQTTGVALVALQEMTELATIEKSLRYLEEEAGRIQTPLSLSWAILGLAAWKRRPEQANRLLAECFARQKLTGAYGSSLLSLLLLARQCPNGLSELLERLKERS